MRHAIVIPYLGATGGDVRIVDWAVREEQHVREGDVLFVVETDKAADEVHAFRDGYVRRILAEAGAERSPGDVVAFLTDTAHEAIDDPAPSNEADARPPRIEQTVDSGSDARRAHQPAIRVPATPRARRLAREHGIDLEAIRPASGEVVQASDVEAALGAVTIAERPSSARSRPLSLRRRAIAERMRKSKSEIPHFYLSVDVDVTCLEDRRRELKAAGSQLASSTLNDWIVAAAARALRETPDLNAAFAGNELHVFDDVDVGVAIGSEDGIVAPLLRKADMLPLPELSRAVRDLRSRAAAGELKREDLSGGALTISNLGMYGVDAFTAVINPGQAAVLACGSARRRPWVVDGRVSVRAVMTAILSVDHRVTDGKQAAQFMTRFRALLEQPAPLFEDDRSPLRTST